jgi:hypothetical protein
MPEEAVQDKSLTLSSPADAARAAAGLSLQEAVNLGEINPAMARRFLERMDQIYTSLMRGAGVQWNPADGTLKFIYPEVVNPILAAAQARKAKRELESSTAIPEGAGTQPDDEPEVERPI